MDDPNIGREVGGYRIDAVVGRGGMGVVYKAEDIELAKDVALKVIDPAMARNDYFLRQFRREGRSLARIYSPHIVTVHALRQTELGLTLVMEFVDGNTLKDRLARGAIELREAIRICREILLAFRDAHGVDVIHRDVKPANIMLTRDGAVKVTDFGLAKVHDPTSATTVTMGVAGTLYYMSPEQVKGLKDVDWRTDLYSIGMTMYEMVTGRLPFDKSEGAFTIQKRIAEERLDPPTVHKKDLPRPLVKFITRALEKNRDKRFQSAEDMIAALDEVEAALGKLGEPRAARRKERKKPANGRRIWPTVVGIVAVLVSVGAAVAYWFLQPPPPTGGLSLVSVPTGATVTMDGRVVGNTPTSISDLPLGEVSLTLRLDGFEPADTVVAIQEGISRRVVMTLTELEPDDGRTIPVLIGRVAFTSTPSGAMIYVDDEPKGTTPATVDSVLAGERRVVLELGGHISEARNVEVLPASLVRVSVSLTARRDESPVGNLRITSIPEGATVIVDGEQMGRTPRTLLDLRTGSHSIEVVRDGFRRTQRDVTVRRGVTETASFELVPLQPVRRVGRLQVSSTPPAAEVLLDGRSQGSTDLTLEDVTVGSHVIVIRKPGYRDREVSVEVNPNETVRISEVLEQLTGVLRLRVIPWAEVYVDAQRVFEEVDVSGETLELSANVRHRLEADNPELGARCTRWVELQADGPTELLINLTKRVRVPVISINNETGTAFSGAQILVDGMPTGKTTPLPIEFIEGCSYDVTLVMEGYEPGRPTRITLDSNTNERVEIRLRPLR